MSRIKKLYIINHSHTDIGFTDYPDVCLHQHIEFIDKALDLCEETSNYVEEAKFHWTCESAGVVEHYLDSKSSSEIDRFLKWHRAGQIEITAMRYNFTPLLSIEEMNRSLYSIKRLREKYGVNVNSAMQCDVNGVSWIFADLLPSIGVNFLTMAINPERGGHPKPRPSAFWWKGPAGNKLLCWNGYHYLFGRSNAGLGRFDLAEKLLPPIIEKLEADKEYPFDFLFAQATHPTRVDNGPPDRRICDFVRDWNSAGRTPRIMITTLSEFAHMLVKEYGNNLPVRYGDWIDWWADGVASSAYETSIYRSARELIQVAETIGAWSKALGYEPWPTDRVRQVYHQLMLYGEHTWGAFTSVSAPDSAFTRAQWSRKSSFAYSAWAEAHDVLARAAQNFADRIGRKKEANLLFNTGNLLPKEACPPSPSNELLVINTLPWEREVVVDEPERRTGLAPAGLLDMFFPRGVPWGGTTKEILHHRIRGKVPGFGYAFLSLEDTVSNDGLLAGEDYIENQHYRVRIDPKTGGLAEWYDKDLSHDFAGIYKGWQLGQYVYERVDSPKGREALFVRDFSDLENFGHWRKDTPFIRKSGVSVKIKHGNVNNGQVSIQVRISGPGIYSATCIYRLVNGQKSLEIDWLLNKEDVTDPEAVYIVFPINLAAQFFQADINGISITPGNDQLQGTAYNWYPIQRWVDISDNIRGVTIAPIDAPLVQLGGITTGRWNGKVEPESPTLVSWALHNHWSVNFRASQGGKIPLRYRLTTHAGPCDAEEATRFGAESCVPPIVLRGYAPLGPQEGVLVKLKGEYLFSTMKPAQDNNGIILRLLNLSQSKRQAMLSFPFVSPKSAVLVSPLEKNAQPLQFEKGCVRVEVPGRGMQFVRVIF